MSRIPNVSLSNGVLMPAAVFGVYQIRDLKESQKAVEDAIAAGYRAIDTAASYGNEAAVGHAIKACGWIVETFHHNQALGGGCKRRRCAPSH